MIIHGISIEKIKALSEKEWEELVLRNILMNKKKLLTIIWLSIVAVLIVYVVAIFKANLDFRKVDFVKVIKLYHLEFLAILTVFFMAKIGKDGSIFIIDSKPLSSKGIIGLSTKGASFNGKTTNQLSPNRITAVMNRLPDGEPVKDALKQNTKEIKTIVTEVDKGTGEIKFISMKVNNKVQ